MAEAPPVPDGYVVGVDPYDAADNRETLGSVVTYNSATTGRQWVTGVIQPAASDTGRSIWMNMDNNVADEANRIDKFREMGVLFRTAAYKVYQKYPYSLEEAFYDRPDESTDLFPELYNPGVDKTGKPIRRPDEVENKPHN